MATDQTTRALDRGRALAERGELDAAAARFERLLGEVPGCLAARHDLGVVRFRQGRLAEAEAAFRAVLERAPGAVQTLNALGAVLEADGRLAESRDCFARAATLDPGSADAHANLGSVLQAAGKLDAAAAAYRQALACDPMHARALTGLAVLLDLEGRYAAGLELTGRLVERRAAGPELILIHSRLLGHAGREQEAIARLQDLITWPDLPARAEQHARFALAGLLDAGGCYRQAWAEACRANALEPPDFDAAACRDFVARSIRCFDRAALARLPRSSVRSDRPVFIVGMPRSGTTLVEQMLAGHPDIYAAGERNDILWLVEALTRRAAASGAGAPNPSEPRPRVGTGKAPPGPRDEYPELVAGLGEDDLDGLAERYLAGIPEEAARRVTDKMPLNFRHLGLIDRILPGARVIHCRRNPLDTGLSCFMHGLSGPELAFARDLGHIAVYYRAYRELMSHWREVLHLPMLEIRYEALIDDPEREARRMLEFLQLDWEPRCLRFHELGRVVNTASQAQVRRPLFRSSVGRHRHYARELTPLAEALGAGHARPDPA